MNLIRPKLLAMIFAAYFGVVSYYAWQTARRTSGPWFSPEISQVVYQTAMVGGVLVLASMFITATLSPRLHRSMSPPVSAASLAYRTGPPRSRSDGLSSIRPRSPTQSLGPEWWAVEDFLDEEEDQPVAARNQQAIDAAAVSAALSRLLPARSADPGTLMERLSGIRARNSAVLVNDGRETAQVLLRLVDEMKPLLVAAKKAGLNIPEVRRLVVEATAGREGDLTQRVRLVEQVKKTLEAALVERIAEELQGVLVDIERTKAATHKVHGAELTAAEAVALLDTGNFAAALDRAVKARETFESQVGGVSDRPDWVPGPTSFIALIGPSIVAVAYVGIAAMMLPGVGGYLVVNFVLNNWIVLTLSYGWLGLILYALLSVYLVLRPPAMRSGSAGYDQMRQ